MDQRRATIGNIVPPSLPTSNMPHSPIPSHMVHPAMKVIQQPTPAHLGSMPYLHAPQQMSPMLGVSGPVQANTLGPANNWGRPRPSLPVSQLPPNMVCDV